MTGEVSLRPKGLGPTLKERLVLREEPTPEQVASWFRRLGLRSKKDRLGALYTVTRDQLEEIEKAFAPTEIQEEEETPAWVEEGVPPAEDAGGARDDQ